MLGRDPERSLPAGVATIFAAGSQGCSCRLRAPKGLCGTCKSRKLDGSVEMAHSGGIHQREIDAGRWLLCCSKPCSNVVADR